MRNIVRNAYAKFQGTTWNSLAANGDQPKQERKTTTNRARPTRNPVLDAILAIFSMSSNLKFLEFRHAVYSNEFWVARSIGVR